VGHTTIFTTAWERLLGTRRSSRMPAAGTAPVTISGVRRRAGCRTARGVPVAGADSRSPPDERRPLASRGQAKPRTSGTAATVVIFSTSPRRCPAPVSLPMNRRRPGLSTELGSRAQPAYAPRTNRAALGSPPVQKNRRTEIFSMVRLDERGLRACNFIRVVRWFGVHDQRGTTSGAGPRAGRGRRRRAMTEWDEMDLLWGDAEATSWQE